MSEAHLLYGFFLELFIMSNAICLTLGYGNTNAILSCQPENQSLATVRATSILSIMLNSTKLRQPNTLQVHKKKSNKEIKGQCLLEMALQNLSNFELILE